MFAVEESVRDFALDQLKAVEDAAAHVARPLERPAPAAEHRDRLVPRFHPGHKVVIGPVAQQAAPDGGLTDECGPDVDIGRIIGAVLGFLFGARVIECREIGVDRAHVDGHAPQRTVSGQRFPIGDRTGVPVHFARRPGGLCDLEPVKAKRLRRLDPGAKDGIVDHHDRHRRARHDLEILRCPFGHLMQIEPRVMVDDGGNLAVRNADQNDGFRVFDQLRAGQHGLGRDTGDDMDRLAGIPRRRHEIRGEVGPADQLSALKRGHQPVLPDRAERIRARHDVTGGHLGQKRPDQRIGRRNAACQDKRDSRESTKDGAHGWTPMVVLVSG